jgi:NAD+ diphosphatase
MTSSANSLVLPSIAFAGNMLVRLAEKRGPNSCKDAIAHPDAIFVAFSEGKPVIRQKSKERAICHFSQTELNSLTPDYDSTVLLGHMGGRPHLAVPVFNPPDRIPVPFEVSDIRPLFAGNLLSQSALAEIAQAAALLSWNANCLFCGRCGVTTRSEAGGYKRVCTGCAAEHFPRTDPVTIMLVTHEDKCLLARSPRFPESMVSCLAGFIEPGETIEEAVRRETLEEAGLLVGEVTYIASQPWPFPHSLMIGCVAQALNSDIVLEADELESGGWFARADVKMMFDDSHPEGFHVPPSGSIAHYLIRNWVESLS